MHRGLLAPEYSSDQKLPGGLGDYMRDVGVESAKRRRSVSVLAVADRRVATYEPADAADRVCRTHPLGRVGQDSGRPVNARASCWRTPSVVLSSMVASPRTGRHVQPVGAGRTSVVFRYDDCSDGSPTDIELKILDAFRSSRACITFAVVPFSPADGGVNLTPDGLAPLSPAKWLALKSAFEEGILDVALHGYSHASNSVRIRSEFSGLDLGDQVARISRGKEHLEELVGARITTFVPPYNSYDLNTLRALQQLGFTTISAKMTCKTLKGSALKFLPQICDLLQLRSALEAAGGSREAEPVVTVVFHAYDFREVDGKRGRMTLPEFCGLLDWLHHQRDVRVLSISQATRLIGDLSPDRFWRNMQIRSAASLLPAPLRQKYAIRYFEDSPDSLVGVWLLVASMYMVVVALTAFAAAFVGRFVFPAFSSPAALALCAGTAASAILLIYVLRHLGVGFRTTRLRATFPRGEDDSVRPKESEEKNGS